MLVIYTICTMFFKANDRFGLNDTSNSILSVTDYSNCFLYTASNVWPSLSFHTSQPLLLLPMQKSAAVLGLENVLGSRMENTRIDAPCQNLFQSFFGGPFLINSKDNVYFHSFGFPFPDIFGQCRNTAITCKSYKTCKTIVYFGFE